MKSNFKISIVISTFNELGLSFLESSLSQLKGISGVELVLVDGGSTDGTVDLLEKYGTKILSLENSSRAERLNLGIKNSEGEIIFLHHPRSIIDIDSLDFIIRNSEKLVWGGLTHKFDETSLLYRFTSWYSNRVRGRIREILYLDHCIFFKRSLALGDDHFVPEVDIFEDTLLSEKLNKFSAPRVLDFYSKTSAVRFEKNGRLFQSVLNQVMKVCFMMNFSDKTMNKIYEKGLSLNSKY
jgi:glycosyltransferase involved in cell wall biosynthesis